MEGNRFHFTYYLNEEGLSIKCSAVYWTDGVKIYLHTMTPSSSHISGTKNNIDYCNKTA
jgi:hypothetical protein